MSSEITQLPSSVVSQLPSNIAKVENDILGYVTTLVGDRPFASAVSKLNPILPNDAKSQLASNPVEFVSSLVAATAPPTWATAIPLDLAGYFQSVGDDIDSIISNDLTYPPLPQPTLEPRPGSSRPSSVPISSSAVVATSTPKVATSSAYTVTTAPAGTGVLYPSGSGGAGTGSGTGRIVNPTTPPNPSVTPFNSASRWSGMIGAVAALMAVGVGALLLAWNEAVL